MKLKSALFLLLCGIVASSFAQINFEHDLSFQQVLDKAKSEGKLVFIDCYTTWCGPCRMLTNQTFPDPTVGSFFNERFVNLKIDMEKGEGIELGAKYAVRGYPTLLWINPDGSVKQRAMGFQNPEQLLNIARTASDTISGKIPAMREKYNNGERNPNFVSDYLNALTSIGSAADSVLKDFLASLSENGLKHEKYAKSIFNATNNIYSPGVSYLVKNKAFLVKIMGADTYSTKLTTLSDNAVKNAIVKKNNATLNDAFTFMRNAQTKDAEERIAHAQMEFSARINDWKSYDKYATDYIKKYASKNDKELNEISWHYYFNIEEPKLLDKAIKWAKQAIELKNTNENNTIYAYLNYKIGNLKEAELACDYAILRAKEEGSNESSPKGLKALIQAEKSK